MAFIVGVLLVRWFFLSVPRPPQRARGGLVGPYPTLSANFPYNEEKERSGRPEFLILRRGENSD